MHKLIPTFAYAVIMTYYFANSIKTAKQHLPTQTAGEFLVTASYGLLFMHAFNG